MVEQKIIAVIPALNEEQTISKVINGVKGYVDEVILIDDGSVDNTAELAKKEGAVVLSNEENLGYERSIDYGFALAAKREATIILTFDGDGQHSPEDIPHMVEPILKGEADIVTGVRAYYPRVTEYLFALVAKIKADIKDPLCGFKAYHVKVYKDLGYFDRNSSIGVQFIFNAKKKGYRIAQRNITIKKRKDVSRFGRKLEANWKIFKAIVKTI
ncbi:hypothetical protein MNBD_GAMMA03-466 [hydrothermal vent metagenome]|uniref:Glycosyltransferase 2-like domain-containing protein n=1 Tax=hydrothermal vent metagenome TaxID=652676 RepID=A0A3B0WDQ2_9ZZZZ